MVQIITDTTSCLPAGIEKRFTIPVIPQVINFGEQSFFEGVELTIDEFIKRLKSSTQLPKTSAPPPELFRREFERIRPSGEPVLCIHPSAEVSGTVRSVSLAAEEFPDMDIRIIDTRIIAGPLATIVLRAAELAESGMDIDSLENHVKQLANRSRIYFLVDTLEYLARGGRIGGASALLGGILQIKPILRMNDGRVDQYERERTHKRAVDRLKQIVLEQIARDGSGKMTIMEADARAAAEELASELGTILFQPKVPIYQMPPAIITHAGPGILAVGFLSKD